MNEAVHVPRGGPTILGEAFTVAVEHSGRMVFNPRLDTLEGQTAIPSPLLLTYYPRSSYHLTKFVTGIRGHCAKSE